MLASCELREDNYKESNGYSETIGFRVVDHHTQTRGSLAKINTEEFVYSNILRSEDGKDSLYLNAYISDMNIPAPNGLETRAGAFTTNDLTEFIVYGYNYSGTLNHDNCYVEGKTATKNASTNTFNFPSTEIQYWEPNQTQFYCIANAPTGAGYTIARQTGEAPKLQCDFSSPDFSVSDQRDVVIAATSSQANVDAVPLNFKHVLTAVEFQLIKDENIEGFIHSVSIKNIHLKGTLDLGYGGGFLSERAWRYNDEGTGTFAINARESGLNISDVDNNTPIASLTNTFAMMAIPQLLQNVELIIRYSRDGNETNAIDLKAGITGTWTAGQRVLYKLSLKDVLNANFFTTTGTEICLDAHYVTNIDVLGIKLGSNVKSWQLEIITKEKDGDWLKLQTNEWNEATDLRDLQTEGYWVSQYFYGGNINQYNENGEIEARETITAIPAQKIIKSTNSRDIERKFVLLAEENTSENIRLAQVKLTVYSTSNYTGDNKREIFYGDLESEKTCFLKQMCPQYINYNGNIIGSERIEEAPLTVPWGTYYKLQEGADGYVQDLPAPSVSGWGDVLRPLEAAIRAYLAGQDVVTSSGGFLGYGATYHFNMTDIISDNLANTSSLTNGQNNTQNGFSTQLLNTNAFMQWLLANNGNEINNATFEVVNNDASSAFMNVIKKNKITAAKRTQADMGQSKTVYYADIDNSEINWYLPSIGEATSGVYQDNSAAHVCETSFFDESGTPKTYWTSSTYVNRTDCPDGRKAYYYTYGDAEYNNNKTKEKNEVNYVRAVRIKPAQ